MLKNYKIISTLMVCMCILCSCASKAENQENLVIGTLSSTGLDKLNLSIKNTRIAIIDSKISVDFKNVSVKYGTLCPETGYETHANDIIRTAQSIFPGMIIDLYEVADNDGYVDNDELLKALKLVKKNKYDVLNMSFCTKENSDITKELNDISENGTIIVASAGNEGNNEVGYPASLSNVLSIGAIGKSGELEIYSNNGKIDFVMPGTFELLSEKRTITGTSISAILFSCALLANCEQKNIMGEEAIEYMKGISENPKNDPKIGYGQPIFMN